MFFDLGRDSNRAIGVQSFVIHLFFYFFPLPVSVSEPSWPVCISVCSSCTCSRRPPKNPPALSFFLDIDILFSCICDFLEN